MARILLLEPDRLLAGTYKAALMAAGYKVVVCAGAQAAIMAADQNKPDMVILELQLVEHSGIEFLYEFRSYPEWQDIPVIIQTVIPSAEFAESQHLLKNELGVRVFLYKPHTSLRSLLAKVNEFIPVKA